jgi:hypothetical protein
MHQVVHLIEAEKDLANTHPDTKNKRIHRVGVRPASTALRGATLCVCSARSSQLHALLHSCRVRLWRQS